VQREARDRRSRVTHILALLFDHEIPNAVERVRETANGPILLCSTVWPESPALTVEHKIACIFHPG
jgi:hypothetical protein